MIRILFTIIITFFSTGLFSSELAESSMSNAGGAEMTGWTMVLTGILVAFVGLILVLICINIFRIFYKNEQEVKISSKLLFPPNMEPAQKIEIIPEEHVIAIATAVELYKRLYLVNSMGSLTFKHTDSRSWKIVNKYGQR